MVAKMDELARVMHQSGACEVECPKASPSPTCTPEQGILRKILSELYSNQKNP